MSDTELDSEPLPDSVPDMILIPRTGDMIAEEWKARADATRVIGGQTIPERGARGETVRRIGQAKPYDEAIIPATHRLGFNKGSVCVVPIDFEDNSPRSQPRVRPGMRGYDQKFQNGSQSPETDQTQTGKKTQLGTWGRRNMNGWEKSGSISKKETPYGLAMIELVKRIDRYMATLNGVQILGDDKERSFYYISQAKDAVEERIKHLSEGKGREGEID